MKVNQSCIKQTFGVTFSISHSRVHLSPNGMTDWAGVGAKFQMLIQMANQLLNSYSFYPCTLISKLSFAIIAALVF